MNWFKNANFRDKFFLAFGILLSFVLILSALAVITINNVETAFIRLADGPNRRLMYASDAAAELANCRRYILAIYYSLGDDDYINACYMVCEKSIESVRLYLDLYYDNFINDAFLSDAEKESRVAIITELKDRIDGDYRENVDDLYAAAKTGDRQLLDKLAAEGVPLGEEITNTLRTFRALVQQHVDDITEQTHLQAQRSITMLIAIAVLLFILTLFTSIFMSAAIRGPIVRMEEAMYQIAKGNLSYSIRSECKDELGMLSNHIGDMVDTISMLNKAVAIVDNVDELIFVTDLDNNLIYLNNKAIEVYGLDGNECVGKKCYHALYGDNAVQCVFCPMPKLIEQKESMPSCDWEHYDKINGKEIWFKCKTSIIRWVDGSLVLITTYKDNTLQKQHEEQQKRHEIELRESALLAEEASRAKSAFLASMSHEIRTPMNAVMGMSELILRKDLPQDVYENAQGIKSASQNLLAIINDILDFSKIESGKLEIIETEYDFPSLVNDVIGVIRIRLLEKPVRFVVNIAPHLPLSLIGDEVRVRQTLINLLSNAVKYTNEGIVSMTVSGKVSDGAVDLSIDISDTGVGIKEEDMEKLFGDFVQIDVAKNKGVEGTGLGLAISRNLCRAMGGDITARSEYGKGSTFTVKLPQRFTNYEPFASVDEPENNSVLIYETRHAYRDSIIVELEALGVRYKSVESILEFFDSLRNYNYVFVPAFILGSVSPALDKLEDPPKLVILADVADHLPPRGTRVLTLPAHSRAISNVLNDVCEEEGSMQGTGISFTAPDARVLIVDDITTNLMVVKNLMAPYEMQITVCSSGYEALDLLKEERYDLIFMDHMMPEMDGLEATARIREMDGEFFEKIPIIALTANAVSGVREMFIQNGMNDFLAKPIEMPRLNSILEKWIPKEKRLKARPVEQPDEKSAFVDALKTIQGLSVDEAVASMGGSQKTYDEVVRLSADLLPENIDSLNSLIDTDLQNYSIAVHGVKGVLNNIGAYELGKAAFELEQLSKRGDADACARLHPGFILELTGFLYNVKVLTDKTEAAQKSEGDKESLLGDMAKAEEAADFFDAALALEIVEADLEYTYSDEIDQKILKLKLAFEHFDFDKALELIKNIKEELVLNE